MAAKVKNRYTKIIEAIFDKHYSEGVKEIDFEREEFSEIAKQLKIKLPKNLGDILYTFRYRANYLFPFVKELKKDMNGLSARLGEVFIGLFKFLGQTLSQGEILQKPKFQIVRQGSLKSTPFQMNKLC